MKVCIVLGNSNRVGVNYYNRQEIGLAKALAFKDVFFDIFEYSATAKGVILEKVIAIDGKDRIRLFRYAGIELPGKQLFSYQLFCYLCKLGNNYSLIQVHENTSVISLAVCWACYFIKCRCILVQGVYRDYAGFLKRLIMSIYLRLFMRFFFKHIKYAICKTSDALNYIQEKGLPNKTGCSVVSVGLDVSEFLGGKSRDIDIELKCLSLAEVLYVGEVSPRRNPEFIVSLFKYLAEADCNIKFRVVGDGSKAREFEESLRTFGLSHRVSLFKKIKNSDMAHIYQKSKVLILPTSYEIYGMAVMEAMYFGLPVVASAEAGPRQLISDGVDGYLMHNFLVKDWGDKVLNLLRNDNLHLLFARKASLKIREKFVWEKLADEYYAIYKKICALETARSESVLASF